MPVQALTVPVQGDETARAEVSLFASEAWPLVATTSGPAVVPVALSINGSSGYLVFVVASATRSVATVHAVPVAREFVLLDATPPE